MDWIKLVMFIGMLLCMLAISVCGGMLLHTHVADIASAIELFIVISAALSLGILVSESSHRP